MLPICTVLVQYATRLIIMVLNMSNKYIYTHLIEPKLWVYELYNYFFNLAEKNISKTMFK